MSVRLLGGGGGVLNGQYFDMGEMDFVMCLLNLPMPPFPRSGTGRTDKAPERTCLFCSLSVSPAPTSQHTNGYM